MISPPIVALSTGSTRKSFDERMPIYTSNGRGITQIKKRNSQYDPPTRRSFTKGSAKDYSFGVTGYQSALYRPDPDEMHGKSKLGLHDTVS